MFFRVVLLGRLTLLASGLAALSACAHERPTKSTSDATGGSGSGTGGTGAEGTKCPSGQTDCSGTCADLKSNEANCGTCGKQCATGTVCTDGQCKCMGSRIECDGTCVDAQTDSARCGNCTTQCGAGQICSSGSCGCRTGQDLCSDACTYTQSDGAHCGNCTTSCSSGQACSKGSCASGCASGETECTTGSTKSCVSDLSSNSQHCGRCNNACSGNQTCNSGTCGCPSGQELCGSTCIDVQTDVYNCGKCGTSCLAGQTCEGGKCKCFDASEQFCNGACVNTQTDPANCGACVNRCETSCESGACKDVIPSCGDQVLTDKYSPGYPQEEFEANTAKAQELLGGLSLPDKAAQMRGVAQGTSSSPNWSDLQRSYDTDTIRGMRFRDGPRGVNVDEDFQGVQSGKSSTAFPVTMARGATFDVELEYKIGEAVGDEMAAIKEGVMLAPCMNLLRHPGWGRAQETYGEDPIVLGRMAAAYTAGVQQYVAGCAKHYAGNNIENDRSHLNSQMEDEQTLREIYGRHFKIVVQEGGVSCVMAAYNKVNGVKSTQNKHLLTDILRNDFGFKGFVLSDWWAMPNDKNIGTDENILKSTAVEAVKAGLDIEVPWHFNFGQLESLVPSQLSTQEIDAAVLHILAQKVRFNMWQKSGSFGRKAPVTTWSDGKIGNDQSHIELALQAALKSMVLLKNENKTLPIPSTAKKVAVLGLTLPFETPGSPSTPAGQQVSFATGIHTGDLGSSRVFSDPAKSVTPFAGIKEAAGSIEVVSGTSASDASNADFVVVVVGLTAEDEGEEYTGAGDRSTFSLDGKRNSGQQNQLVTEAAALGKPMAVVLIGGSVIDMPWLSQVPSVVMAWYPGLVGGRALGQLLFGKANFGGKLPFTWPTYPGWEQLPTFNEGETTRMEYYVGYRWYDKYQKSWLFPFGHGLSYTNFEYKRLQLGCTDVTKGGVVKVKVNVANTGTFDGEEVIMVFVSYPNTTARRPAKELKAFTRVSLAAGQEKQVEIPLRVKDLDYWKGDAGGNWEIESGNIEIKVGRNAATLPLKATLPVK